MDVTIDICDLSGRSVHRLTSAQRSSGSYSDIWNGRDEYGNALPPGLYIVRVAIDGDFKQFEDVRLRISVLNSKHRIVRAAALVWTLAAPFGAP